MLVAISVYFSTNHFWPFIRYIFYADNRIVTIVSNYLLNPAMVLYIMHNICFMHGKVNNKLQLGLFL